MAKTETEYAFVLGFWQYAADPDAQSYATRIMSGVMPEHLEQPVLREVYATITDRMTQDLPTDPGDVQLYGELAKRCSESPVLDGLHADVQIYPRQKLGHLVTEILESHNARRQRRTLTEATAEMDELLKSGLYAAARTKGESTALELLALGAERPGKRTLRSREELTKALLAAGEHGTPAGIAWPWPRLQRVLGFLPRGAVAGITGEPGTGKTTVLGNLFMEWTRRDVVCLVYSTEMRSKFLNRAYATEAGIPQRIAEQELFNVRDAKTLRILAREWGCDELTARTRTVAYWDQFKPVVEAWQEKPWEVVDISDLKPKDLMGFTRHIRRRYAGAHVVVMVDHMLNLAFDEREKAALYVGGVTTEFREMCQDDQDGGMSGVLLFQPKKGEVGKERLAAYRPVAAGAIKGAVASVLDVHFSPYRVLLDEDGKPTSPAKVGDEGTVDDSENIYLKPDKNRTGGPSPTQILRFDANCGRIWEEDHHHAERAEWNARMGSRRYDGRGAAAKED